MRLKFNIFRKEKKRDFVFKYLRFKKRKLKILSREISLPVVYQKELIIKHPVMVKPSMIYILFLGLLDKPFDLPNRGKISLIADEKLY